MNLKTSQFGEIELVEENIVTFPDGIIGFEEYKKFILISDNDYEPLIWLLSMEDTQIEFPLINPYLVYPEYEPGILVTKDEIILTIVTLKNDIKKITTNLRAPLLFDLKKREGKQVIINSENYGVSHNIFKIIKV